VASLGFSRLPHYYDAQLLASSMVVFVPRVPVPHCRRWASTGSATSSKWTLEASRTSTRISFVPTSLTRNRSISMNWFMSSSGGAWPGKFLAFYADGLERFGYRNSPLEVMANNLQTGLNVRRSFSASRRLPILNSGHDQSRRRTRIPPPPMSMVCNRRRFRAAAVYAVVGVTLTGWSSVFRASPLLPSG